MTMLFKWISYLYLPAIFYIILLIVKLTVGDLPLDLPGAHSVLGVIFIISGLTICFAASIVHDLFIGHSDAIMPKGFWLLATFLFFILFFDAAYGIHERMWLIGLPEVAFFAVEGALLVGIVALYFKTIDQYFLRIFALFVVASGAAVLGDSSASGEGTFTLYGAMYSYEQTLETFAMLLLSAAFMRQAYTDLKTMLQPAS